MALFPRDGQLYDATVRQLYLDSSGGGKVEVLWHGEASVDWVDVDHLQQHSKCGTVLYNKKNAKEWLKGKVHSIRGDGSVALETNSFSTFLGGRQRFHTKQIRQHLKSNQINGKG